MRSFLNQRHFVHWKLDSICILTCTIRIFFRNTLFSTIAMSWSTSKSIDKFIQCRKVIVINDIHSWYKQIIYDINYKNVEQALLNRKNLRQTFRFILLQAFANSKLSIIATLTRIFNTCSSLFNALLFVFYYLKNLENEDSFDFVENKTYRSSISQDVLSIKQCSNNCLSLRIDKANDLFKRRLSQAYQRNYEMSNVLHFEHVKIKWCKKFNYINRLITFVYYHSLQINALFS